MKFQALDVILIVGTLNKPSFDLGVLEADEDDEKFVALTTSKRFRC
mgnify:CR=1 FL=1